MTNARSEDLLLCATSLTGIIDGEFRHLCENSKKIDGNYSAETIRNNLILYHNNAHINKFY
jgi:hypothetical protein